MIPNSESLTVEFKSDRKRLSDAELVEALVCLANTEGGELWLGVEDDGQATGLHADHMALTGLAGMVAARTLLSWARAAPAKPSAFSKMASCVSLASPGRSGSCWRRGIDLEIEKINHVEIHPN